MKKQGFIIYGLVLLLVIGLPGCVVPSVTPAAAVETGFTLPLGELSSELTSPEVQVLYMTEAIFILDVREPDEFAAGHIPGATLIPLDSLPNRLNDIPRDQPVVIVCRSGNRSGQAQRYLQEQGFTNVRNMLGGMLDWSNAGYDIE